MQRRTMLVLTSSLLAPWAPAPGPKIAAQDEGAGVPTILIAASEGRLEEVRSALDNGADPDLRGPAGQTALMLAAGGGHEEIVALLLDRGADPSAWDQDEDTALGAYAAARGHTRVVEMLIEAGGSPLIANRSGMTPLMFAALYGHLETMNVLEDAMLPLAAAQSLSELAVALREAGRSVDADRIERRAAAIQSAVDAVPVPTVDDDPPLFLLAGSDGRCFDLGFPRLTRCVNMSRCRYTRVGTVRVTRSGEGRDEKDLVERFVDEARRFDADAVTDVQIQISTYTNKMAVLAGDAISFTDEGCKRAARGGGIS